MTPQNVLNTVVDVMGGRDWGPVGCSHAAAEVFRRLWGCDLLMHAGCDDDPVRAAAALRRSGQSLPILAQRVARRNLLTLYGCPHSGAIGLIRTMRPDFGGVAAAICVQPGQWAAVAPGGFAITTDDAFLIWGLPPEVLSCRS